MPCGQGFSNGAIAQLGERLLCKQEVAGSIPAGSTNSANSVVRAQGNTFEANSRMRLRLRFIDIVKEGFLRMRASPTADDRRRCAKHP